MRTANVRFAACATLLTASCAIASAAAPSTPPAKPGSLIMTRSTTAPASSNPASTPVANRGERVYAWHVANMVDAYERVGRRDPKWDETARQALAIASQSWAERRVINADQKILAAAEQAVAAGCDDALLLYVHARIHNGLNPRSPDNGRLHETAADALAKSGYSAYFKSLSSLRAAEFLVGSSKPEARAAAERRLAATTAYFPEIGRGADVPVTMWFKITLSLTGAYINLGNDRTAAYEKVAAALKGAAPETVSLTVKGRYHKHHAWDARGGAYADKVTEEGWKGMRERLVLAQQALERAWQLDNTNAEAAATMIDVELGQGQGRQRMELWFRRATKADPNYYEAYTNKLYYLEPKWYGSPRDMIAFGRQCLNEGNWEGMIPFVLVDAHESLSHYFPDGDWQPKRNYAYFREPAVWKDVSSVFERFLELHPDSIAQRTRYAVLAYHAQQWAVADEQFTLVADYPSRAAALRPADFEAMRKESAEKAKTQQPGPKDGRL